MAERVGFEPKEGFPSAVFKTAAIDHSAISPKTISFSSPPGGEATYYGTGILYCKTRFTRKTRRGVTRRARSGGPCWAWTAWFFAGSGNLGSWKSRNHLDTKALLKPGNGFRNSRASGRLELLLLLAPSFRLLLIVGRRE